MLWFVGVGLLVVCAVGVWCVCETARRRPAIPGCDDDGETRCPDCEAPVDPRRRSGRIVLYDPVRILPIGLETREHRCRGPLAPAEYLSPGELPFTRKNGVKWKS